VLYALGDRGIPDGEVAEISGVGGDVAVSRLGAGVSGGLDCRSLARGDLDVEIATNSGREVRRHGGQCGQREHGQHLHQWCKVYHHDGSGGCREARDGIVADAESHAVKGRRDSRRGRAVDELLLDQMTLRVNIIRA